ARFGHECPPTTDSCAFERNACVDGLRTQGRPRYALPGRNRCARRSRAQQRAATARTQGARERSKILPRSAYLELFLRKTAAPFCRKCSKPSFITERHETAPCRSSHSASPIGPFGMRCLHRKGS